MLADFQLQIESSNFFKGHGNLKTRIRTLLIVRSLLTLVSHSANFYIQFKQTWLFLPQHPYSVYRYYFHLLMDIRLDRHWMSSLVREFSVFFIKRKITVRCNGTLLFCFEILVSLILLITYICSTLQKICMTCVSNLPVFIWKHA